MLKSDQVQLVKELSKTQYKIFAKKIELVELEERLLKGEDVTVDDLEPQIGSIEVSVSGGGENYKSFTFDLTKRSTEDNLFYTYGSYSSDTRFKTITGLPLGDYKIIITSIPEGCLQIGIGIIYTIDENHLNISGAIHLVRID
jgi:hypothetical protein